MTKLSIALVLLTSPAFGQAQAKDSDTLQKLLVEVHELRQSIEGMTVASQRVQIALYGLQLQDSAIDRAEHRAEAAHDNCQGVERGRQQSALELQVMENRVTPVTQQGPETEARRQTVSDLKNRLEKQDADVRTCQASEAEAATQLRNEQSKMAELQDRIARLDKALEQLSGK